MSSKDQVGHRASEDFNLDEDQLEILEKNFSNGSRQPNGATLMLIAAEAGLSEAETTVGSLTHTPDKDREGRNVSVVLNIAIKKPGVRFLLAAT